MSFRVSFRCIHCWLKKYQANSVLPRVSILLILTSAAFAATDGRQALQQAADLAQAGQIEEAEAKARIALLDPATRAAANSVLGTIRFQQKRLPESTSFFQEAIRLEPRLIGAHLTLGQIYSIEGNPNLATKMFQRVLALDRHNTSARMALAQIECANGHYQQSLAFAKLVAKELRSSPEGLIILAQDYLGTGEREHALALVKVWETFADVPVELSAKFGIVLAKQGALLEAIEVMEQAKQDGNPSYELAFNLAVTYQLNKDGEHALENYDLALNRNHSSLPVLKQAAVLAESRNELERSLSYWVKAKKLRPEDPEILLGFGRVCLKMDLLQDAEPALTKAALLQPNGEAYQYTLASAKVGNKQFAEAESIFSKLVERNPQESQYQYALGSVLYLEGKLSEAVVHLSESIRLRPQQLTSYYYQALIERDQGRDVHAVQILEKLLHDYPEHAPSLELLGELQMAAQHYPEAEASLEKAVQLDPKSIKGNYQLGLLLARVGKKGQADRQFEIAKSLRTEHEKTSRSQLRLLDPDQ